MPITSGPSGVSSRIGEPDEAPPVSQVCSSSASGSAEVALDLLPIHRPRSSWPRRRGANRRASRACSRGDRRSGTRAGRWPRSGSARSAARVPAARPWSTPAAPAAPAPSRARRRSAGAWRGCIDPTITCCGAVPLPWPAMSRLSRTASKLRANQKSRESGGPLARRCRAGSGPRWRSRRGRRRTPCTPCAGAD